MDDNNVNVTLDAPQIENIELGLRKRREGKDAQFLSGSERVDLTYLGDLRFVASKKEFKFPIDEPESSGGTNSGPNPLAYFVAGSASCLMMQYVRLAIASKVSIESFELTARGHFDRQVGGAFTEMIYEIRMKSSESRNRILDLSKEAERLCYVHNTMLKAGVKMQTDLTLNGEKIT